MKLSIKSSYNRVQSNLNKGQGGTLT
uniref:Uncharacterized protein n=1 Tax=Rhizophora mucronata TaxID=61149 RepID=A0A2P2PLS1_RHIMU